MDNTCRLCNSKNTTQVTTMGDIFYCSDCGSLNRKTVNTDYEANSYWYKETWLATYQKSLLCWFEESIQIIPSIEIGAADGDFLHLVSQVTKQPCIYNELVDMCRPLYTQFIDKWIGSIETKLEQLQGLRNHNIFMIDVIEHLLHPGKLLQAVPSSNYVYLITNDGDGLYVMNEMLYHSEHSCIMNKKGIDWICSNLGYELIQYIRTPQMLTAIILYKK